MRFILRSEVESIDIRKGYIVKQPFCPSCRKNHLIQLDKTKIYTKYHCWNKECKEKEVPFVVLNEYIDNEKYFEPLCYLCDKPFNREFQAKGNEMRLSFYCEGQLCEAALDPFRYNLSERKWEGKPPKIKIFEESDQDHRLSDVKNNKGKKKFVKKEIVVKVDSVASISNNNSPVNNFTEKSSELQKKIEIIRRICPPEEIPLLHMDSKRYSRFLAYHNNKVAVIIDAPNFIRTLRSLFRQEFDVVLKKAHELLLEFIEASFSTNEKYIICYYSKPDKDLQPFNAILQDFCDKDPLHEFFHLLKIEKAGHYSDIDNYIIANSVEILEKCELKGFVIVSSDKDYLPVMRIANFKGVKSRILGINTPEIYEEYKIVDIKFLGIMNFFKNFQIQ